FLAECMSQPLHSVLESRGGLAAVGYRTPVRRGVETLGVRVDFRLTNGNGRSGHYSFKLREAEGYGFVVQREQGNLIREPGGRVWFDRKGSRFDTNVAGMTPAVDPQALALPIIGGVVSLAPLLKALAAMRVYAMDARRMREMPEGENGPVLKRDGSN